MTVPKSETSSARAELAKNRGAQKSSPIQANSVKLKAHELWDDRRAIAAVLCGNALGIDGSQAAMATKISCNEEEVVWRVAPLKG